MKHIYDMVIIGGGPGGYTAALYAARAGLDTIVLEKLSAGGQMALTSIMNLALIRPTMPPSPKVMTP